MELYPGVYQIHSLFGGRNLFQYLFVGDNVVLVDTGIAETPEKVVFPYLDSLRLKPERLTLAITTHADLDHQGGNDAIKRTAPGAWLACGEADREMVEDPQALFALRYNHLEREHSVSIAREFLPFAGQRRRVDLTFTGGETIRLSDGWSLEVLHVPGHSHGHLALYDRTRRAAFVGDAIHGRGCPSARGELAIPVTYYYVDIYLSTLRYFETLAIDVLYSGHWPEIQGEEIRDFVALSRQTVETIDRAILRALDKQAGGLTLEQLIDVAADAIGDWPPESLVLAMWPVYGHMERLVGRGRVRVLEGARPAKWQKV